MTTLAAALSNSATEMRVNAADADPAEYYTIDSEVIRVLANSTTVQDGLSPERSVDTTLWQIQRGHGPTMPASHLSGATLTPFPGVGGGAAEEGTVVVQLTGTETNYGHFYVGDEDPVVAFSAELVAGDLWVDTSFGPPYSHKERNGTNDGWNLASLTFYDALGNVAATIEGGEGLVTLNTFDAAGQRARLKLDSDGQVLAEAYDDTNAVIATIAMNANGDEKITVAAAAGILLLSDILTVGTLPSADPLAAGQLWQDAGAVKISGG